MKLITTNYALLYFLALVLICEIGLSTASSSSSSSSSYAEEADEGFIRMKTSTLLGGLREYKGNDNNNDAEIENLGRFAVQEHNKKENQLLEFGKVIKAKQQVVAGMMYHLTLEAVDTGKRKIYEAKVWVKPWMNFKQLQEFRHSDDDDSSTTSSEVVVEEDIHEAGWKKVPIHDSSVLEAAQYAIEAMHRRSNCLGRCFLPKLVLAKTKVIENGMKFYLVMKTKWHSRVDTNKVMLTKNINGKFSKFEFL